jgi:hypothetical protein
MLLSAVALVGAAACSSSDAAVTRPRGSGTVYYPREADDAAPTAVPARAAPNVAPPMVPTPAPTLEPCFTTCLT